MTPLASPSVCIRKRGPGWETAGLRPRGKQTTENGVCRLRKTYVLDTSVLIHDPDALLRFDDNTVVIPAASVEQLDAQKHRIDEVGKAARAAIRTLDSLRVQGRLDQGVLLPGGGCLRVELNHQDVGGLGLPSANLDNRVLVVALHLTQEAPPEQPVVLVSRDAILRIKADAVGVLAQDYLNDRAGAETTFYGWRELQVSAAVIDAVYRQRAEAPPAAMQPNEFAILRDAAGSPRSAVVRFCSERSQIRPLLAPEDPVWGVNGRNVQQKMALELLLDDSVSLVTLCGKAGTGKTLLALAAGLTCVEERRQYQRLTVARPVVPMGRDIGFLPGDKDEKLRPWVQPIYDNLEHLFGLKGGRQHPIEDVMAGMQSIAVEPLTYIRGRSMPGQYLIVDEVQNLTRHEVKTIITRAGEGTKVVLLGDPDQTDHPYLDAANNGLVYVRERFKGETLAGHVTLVKGERSRLAQLAADLL